ncbi:MAG: phosphotransferase family protein, partial [Alphaproteobacteria bacterium]|nr:phosphotransferase family protein [Alphaproteobacteria bacterium]
RVEGHDRFQLAVARNALGMIARDDAIMPALEDADLAQEILGGGTSLDEPGLLAELKTAALEKLAADVPKYPALEAAWKQWVGEE